MLLALTVAAFYVGGLLVVLCRTVSLHLETPTVLSFRTSEETTISRKNNINYGDAGHL